MRYYADGDYTLVWPNDEAGLTVRGECFKVLLRSTLRDEEAQIV